MKSRFGDQAVEDNLTDGLSTLREANRSMIAERCGRKLPARWFALTHLRYFAHIDGTLQ